MNEDDLIIEAYPPIITGGQKVTVSRCGVKVTHKPSGLIAICETERSQYANKIIAIEMIEYGLTKIR